MNYFKFGISSRLMTYLLPITVLHQVLVLRFQSLFERARLLFSSYVHHTINQDQAFPCAKHLSGSGIFPHSLTETSLFPLVTSTSAWNWRVLASVLFSYMSTPTISTTSSPGYQSSYWSSQPTVASTVHTHIRLLSPWTLVNWS